MGIIILRINKMIIQDKSKLKSKTFLLASQGCKIKDHYQYLDWIPIFEKFFSKVIIFSTRDNYFRYGREKMNKLFLDKINDEKPDFILLSMNYDEFEPETLLKIKEVAPNSKLIHFFGDDEWRFEDWSRYYAPFFDYCLATEKDISEYKNDNIKNVYSLIGTNSERFKPLNLEKKYKIVFVGAPISDRPEYIRFLMKNNVPITIFNPEWEKYPEFKEIYGGYLSHEDYVKMINQTKINLSFSKGFLPGSKKGQVKGRSFEIPACKAFMLVEDTQGGLRFYLKNLNKISFQNKEELLEKISYFLEHDKEREELSNYFYKQVINNYTWELQFKKFFDEISSKNNLEKKIDFINKINQKVYYFSENDLNLSDKELLAKIKNYDYISFSKGKCEKSKYKDYFQVYSIKKSGKQISCCDYYVSSKSLGNYLLFPSKKAFYFLEYTKFNKLLNINQITVIKEYFLNNIDNFKLAFNGDFSELIIKDNTIFVSIPLISIDKLNVLDYNVMKKAFQMRFRDNLFSLLYQKKPSSIIYFFNLLFTSLSGKQFIIRYLFDSILNKENLRRLISSK